MSRRSPSLLLVHAVWATYDRLPYLPPSLDPHLHTMLGRHAREVGCQLIAAGCASDHVHVIARLSSSVALGELLRRMKGASAHELNHPRHLTKHFAWQIGYWAESLSPADLNPTIDYVTSQRQHHDAAHPAERWAMAPTFSGNRR